MVPLRRHILKRRIIRQRLGWMFGIGNSRNTASTHTIIFGNLDTIWIWNDIFHIVYSYKDSSRIQMRLTSKTLHIIAGLHLIHSFKNKETCKYRNSRKKLFYIPSSTPTPASITSSALPFPPSLPSSSELTSTSSSLGGFVP